MSSYFDQMREGGREATRLLRERLARQEIGDAAYDEAATHTDQRGFKLFGLVFIVAFALVVFGVALAGY